MDPVRKTPLGIAFTKAALCSALAIGWGVILFSFADSSPDGDSLADAYQVHGIAIALMAIGFVGFVYWMMKQRAPSPPDRRPAEPSAGPAEPVFDADAALQHYLATRDENATTAAPMISQQTGSSPARFGRRGVSTNVDARDDRCTDRPGTAV